MNKNDKIYLAGHKGLVGSAILRRLKEKGYQNFILRTFEELDLSQQEDADNFFMNERPDYVIDAAAKVGGIMANNTYRAQFIYENLMIQNNIIHSAYKYGAKKLLFLGSSCIYPKLAPQPLKEEYLLTGELEPTNEPYAIAKIAGIKMCESYFRQYGSDFISVMPTNLYGPNDNFNLETSHVLPAMLRKLHLAKCLMNNDWQAIRSDLERRPVEGINGNSDEKEITGILNKYGINFDNQSCSLKLWGSGKPLREFMYVDDMAAACVYVIENVDAHTLYEKMGKTHINIGTGSEISIADLSGLIAKLVGFNGKIEFDHSKPDGTPRKLMDNSLLHKLGFQHETSLEEGIGKIYEWYLKR